MLVDLRVFSMQKSKDHLVIDASAFDKVPIFMINADLQESCPWQVVVTEQVLPACMEPAVAFSVGSWFKIKEQLLLVKGAIQQGVLLTVPQLKAVVGFNKIEMPEKGSGKKGAYKKIDWATAVARHFCPDFSQEDLNWVISQLMSSGKTKVDLDVLQYIQMLDVDNAQAFRELKKDAVEEFQNFIRRKGKAPDDTEKSKKRKHEEEKPDEPKAEEVLIDAEEEAKKKAAEAALAKRFEEDKLRKEAQKRAEGERLWGLTPHWFRDLLPGRGSFKGASAQYHPMKNYFQVRYPSVSLGRSLVFCLFCF